VEARMREWIFGRPMKRDILDTLRSIAQGGITVHTQAVLCPGRNDGSCLDQTIVELESLHENIASLAVVPVGLTGHRQGLPVLRPYRPDEMHHVMDQVMEYQRRYLMSERASRFVFLSDEWYIETDRTVPEEEAYEGYPQLDNGVGMTRSFVDEIDDDIVNLGPTDLPERILIVTGALGENVFSRYVSPIFKRHGRSVPDILAVKNRFFGETVTCSGLLTFEDIVDALGRCDARDRTIHLPPNVLNFEDKFLDGPSLEDFRNAMRGPVVVPRDTLVRAMSGAEPKEGGTYV
jgi:NifB/MoaA-like Fe-S oxidoreductase